MVRVEVMDNKSQGTNWKVAVLNMSNLGARVSF